MIPPLCNNPCDWLKWLNFGVSVIFIFIIGLPSITTQNLCSQAQKYLGSDGVVQGVVNLENTIGYVGLDAVQKYRESNQTKQRCKIKVASMVNKAGVVVDPSVPSAQAAVRSSASAILSNSSCPGFGLCGLLLDASDEDVWPITAITYMLLPLVSTDKDVGCGRMKAVQDYAIWILTNGKVGDIATSLEFAVMSLRTAQAALDIIQRMTCVDKDNVTHHMSDIQDSVYDLEGSGSTLQGDLQSSLTSYYFVQTSVSIHYSSVGSSQGISDLIAGRVDFACSESLLDFTNPVVISRQINMIPVFAGAVAIVYNVPSLDSLILTRKMVNDIFVGTLDTWNDPDIAAVNKNYSESIVQPAPFQPPAAGMIRIVRSDGSGTTQSFTRALYMFAGLPSPPVYSHHPLGGSSLPNWPVSVEPYANGAVCIFSNCTEPGPAPASLPLWAFLGIFCVGLSLLILSLLIFVFYLRRRVEPEEEIRLRRAIEDLRARLFITRKHNYYLSSEKLPWFRSDKAPLIMIPRRAIEAAARMELQEDFDLGQFNAFCVLLEGEQIDKMVDLEGKLSSTQQHEALCHWILEISEKLIKVELERQPGGVYRLLSKRRFSFFVNKVSKIQLWQFHENSRFKQLQLRVQGFMNQVAPWCDERYRELCAEPDGEKLTNYQWHRWCEETKVSLHLRMDKEYASGTREWSDAEEMTVKDTEEVQTDEPFMRALSIMPAPAQMRQDSDEVRAIRIDPEAQLEADLEINSGPTTLIDEGVFLNQLFRRATLLNTPFQQKMIEVVRRHAADTRHAELDLEGVLCPSAAGIGASDIKSFINIRCNFAAGPAVVQVHPAPIKNMARMREKLGEYARVGAAWPLAAHILDPVRMSIVVFGSSQILEVMSWFEKEEETGLKIVRVKNKFAFAAQEVLGGYRDMMISVLFQGPSGLRIIGEVQIQDKVFYDLKLKADVWGWDPQMHSLYKIKRANTAAKIF